MKHFLYSRAAVDGQYFAMLSLAFSRQCNGACSSSERLPTFAIKKCAVFFFARRNVLAFSALRPFQEKFPKISPNFLRQKFGPCVKTPYLCTRKSEMRPTTPHKSEANDL